MPNLRQRLREIAEKQRALKASPVETPSEPARPEVSCPSCGGTDLRYEPLAYCGAGGLVCQSCYHARRRDL